MTEVKISSDMPLPTPRSVISSPSHMMTAVPAVIVMTIVRDGEDRRGSGSGLLCSPGTGCPDRASATMPVDCRIASPMVRYRVYCVIFAWPDWPSFCSSSRRGMTTVSSWMMMLAVMYGMMPSAKTDSFSSAPPLNRLTSESMLGACGRVLRQAWTRRARHAGRRQRGAEPVHRDDDEREQQLLAQVRRAERPDEGGEHAHPPAS